MFSDAKEEPIMYVGGGPRAGVTQVRNAAPPGIISVGKIGC